jgi:hypothetical protein
MLQTIWGVWFNGKKIGFVFGDKSKKTTLVS